MIRSSPDNMHTLAFLETWLSEWISATSCFIGRHDRRRAVTGGINICIGRLKWAAGGRMCSIVLTLVPFSLRSSTLLFVIQIIPEGEGKRKKEKMQIVVKIPDVKKNWRENVYIWLEVGWRGNSRPVSSSEGSRLSVHVFASLNALFSKFSR